MSCYFHMCQSVLRKVNEFGLKMVYETDEVIRGFIRCLSAISHVPVTDVPEVFDLLVQDAPEQDHLDEIITYFEHTYIRGRRRAGRGNHYGEPVFKHEIWNQHDNAADGIARTTNI